MKTGSSGLWQWASEKAELHAQVADYFTQRKEDEVCTGHVADTVGNTPYMTPEQGELIGRLVREYDSSPVLKLAHSTVWERVTWRQLCRQSAVTSPQSTYSVRETYSPT